MFTRIKQSLSGALFGVLIATQALGQTATLLPNGVQQYFNAQGQPVASGTIDYFVPNTNTRKTTWGTSVESVLNQNPNPVLLNAGGYPQNGSSQMSGTYGDGLYRQVVKDQNGITIWDAVTSSTGASSGGGGSGVGDGMPVGFIIPFAGTTLPNHYLYAGGQVVSRSVYQNLMSAITFQSTILCQNGVATITVSTDISDKVPIGAPVEASCFTPGTTVSTKSSGVLTLSTNATSTISTTATIFPWGEGDASTSFNLPDMRGRVLAGRDNLNGTVAGILTSTYYLTPGGSGVNPDAMNAVAGSQSQTLTVAQLAAHTHANTLTDPGHQHAYPDNNIQPGSNSPIAALGPVGTGSGSFPSTSAVTGITINNASQGGGAPHTIVQPTITSDFIIKVLPDSNPVPTGTGRVQLTSDLILYWDSINGSDSNNCIVSGAGACKTLQHAWTLGATQYDLNGFGIKFQGAASQTFTNAGLNTQLSMHGQQAAGKIVIDCAGSSFNQTDGNFAIQTDQTLANPTNVLGIQMLIQNCGFTASSGGGISSNGSTIDLGVGINFGQVTTDHMRAVGGSGIFALQNYTISGGANTHMNAQSSSYVLADNVTVTCTGSPAFATAFAYAIYAGQVYTIGNTYSGCGSATGTRFSATLNGVITTGGSFTYLPGNATVATAVGEGGVYSGNNAANTIAPEVEGSWTPSIIASTSGTFTQSVQVGSYEKNGRNVQLRFLVTTSGSSSPVGQLQISGIPFPSANVANDQGQCFFGGQAGLTNSASYTIFNAIISPNTSVIQIQEQGSGQSGALAAVARATGNPALQGFCSYRAY